MFKMIVYSGPDETFVTTPEYESQFLKDYFQEGGRDVDDFERKVVESVIEITASHNVFTY